MSIPCASTFGRSAVLETTSKKVDRFISTGSTIAKASQMSHRGEQALLFVGDFPEGKYMHPGRRTTDAITTIT